MQKNSIREMKKRARDKKVARKDSLSIKRPKNIIACILVMMLLISSAIFIGYVEKLNALPTKYSTVVFAVIMILFLVVSLSQLTRRGHIVGKVMAVLLCAVMGVGSYYIHATLKTMDKIEKESKVVITEFALTVTADSDIEDIGDLKGKCIGVMSIGDVTTRNEAIQNIENALGTGVETKEYTTVDMLIAALAEDEIDCAMYASSYESLLEEADERFLDKYRVIEVISIEKEIYIDTSESVGVSEVTSKPFIIYVSGIDSEGKVTKNGRSDVNILVVVNPLTHKILMVSTPRDYYVYMPGVTPSGWRDKLTHAGNMGVECSITTLENLYGLEIDYFAKVNFSSFTTIIEVLDGVTVYSEYAFTSIHNNERFTKGENYIDTAERALAFARERYAFKEGDIQRGKNQMELLKGVINKMLSPKILTSYLDILEAASDVVQTNMPTSCFTELVKMQLDNNVGWQIESVWATGTSDKDYCYQAQSTPLWVMVPSQDSVADISDKITQFMNEK